MNVIEIDKNDIWFRLDFDELSSKKNKTVYINDGNPIDKKNNLRKKIGNEEVIEKSRDVHGDRYSYDFLSVDTYSKKITLLCNSCGNKFKVSISNHLYNKCGCNACYGKRIKLSNHDFIEKANLVHNNEYDYSITKFVKNSIEIDFVCNTHGKIRQYPLTHLSRGCPLCNKGYLGENKIYGFLIDKNIKFKHQKSFKKCKNKNKLTFDFYLPDYKILIEYDGKQHFEPVEYFGGVSNFKKTQLHDKIKNDFAKSNGYNLIRIPYYEYNNIENILLNNI